MITIGQTTSGVLHTRKHPPTGTPENTQRTYVVDGCQVICVQRSHGRVVSERFVGWASSEQQAEAMARELAKPVDGKPRGRPAERFMEESDEG